MNNPIGQSGHDRTEQDGKETRAGGNMSESSSSEQDGTGSNRIEQDGRDQIKQNSTRWYRQTGKASNGCSLKA
jgi:hypothetical protein